MSSNFQFTSDLRLYNILNSLKECKYFWSYNDGNTGLDLIMKAFAISNNNEHDAYFLRNYILDEITSCKGIIESKKSTRTRDHFINLENFFARTLFASHAYSSFVNWIKLTTNSPNDPPMGFRFNTFPEGEFSFLEKQVKDKLEIYNQEDVQEDLQEQIIMIKERASFISEKVSKLQQDYITAHILDAMGKINLLLDNYDKLNPYPIIPLITSLIIPLSSDQKYDADTSNALRDLYYLFVKLYQKTEKFAVTVLLWYEVFDKIVKPSIDIISGQVSP